MNPMHLKEGAWYCFERPVPQYVKYDGETRVAFVGKVYSDFYYSFETLYGNCHILTREEVQEAIYFDVTMDKYLRLFSK